MDYFKSFEFHMDFDGQRRAELYFQVIIVIFAVIGLVWGYFVEQFSYTVFTLGAGFVLAGLLTLPPWPIFRRKPLKWQKAIDEETSKMNKKKN